MSRRKKAGEGAGKANSIMALEFLKVEEKDSRGESLTQSAPKPLSLLCRPSVSSLPILASWLHSPLINRPTSSAIRPTWRLTGPTPGKLQIHRPHVRGQAAAIQPAAGFVSTGAYWPSWMVTTVLGLNSSGRSERSERERSLKMREGERRKDESDSDEPSESDVNRMMMDPSWVVTYCLERSEVISARESP